MKNKMKFLIKQSLDKKIKTKWFKAVNILLAILLVGIINIDKIITFFGGDFENVTKIIVVDQTGTYEQIKSTFETMATSVKDFGNFAIEKGESDITQLKENLSEKENQKNIIIEMTVDEKEYLKASITSYNPIDMITKQLLQSTLNSVKSSFALANSNISPEELASITSPIKMTEIATNPDLEENSQAKDIIANSVLVIFIIPFFILIVLLVQMIGAEINDEKTTKSMEIIISNVSPKTHFFSKIIASTGFVLLQAFLLFLYSGLGLLIRYVINGGLGFSESTSIGNSVSEVITMLKNTGILGALAKSIPLILLILVFNLFAFALLAGILASMTTSIEDFQQLQTPLMIICLIGYYLAFMASMFQGASFIRIFSYLPFFSAMIAPVIYLLGQTTIIELIVSTVIAGGTCFLLFHYGIRVYKVGILNYSSKDLWKKVFKSLKQKE